MTAAERKALQARTQDLINEGIEKELAKLMAKIEIEYEITKPVVNGR